MKKLLALLLVLAMAASLFAGCATSSETPAPAESSAPAEEGDAPAEEGGVTFNSVDEALSQEIFGDIEPLAQETELKLGLSAGATAGFVMWFAGELGAYEATNIASEEIVFANGVVMMEAVASDGWDVGQTGLGGTLSGTKGHDIVTIASAAPDQHSMQIFAPKDSPIVAAGQVTDSAPLLYGTADDWKGQEIFVPVGTTLHYTLGLGLEHFGLTTEDMQLTHMEVPNINTALRAGQCELGGVWGNLSYGDLNENFVPVMQAADVGVSLVSGMVANPRSYEDETKQLAIKKFLEIYFDVADWMSASEDNLAIAADYFQQWNEDNGVPTTIEELNIHLTHTMPYTLEQNYEWFNNEGESGYNQQVENNLLPLEFYIGLGQYEEADKDKFMDPSYTPDKLVTELYNEK